MPWEGLASVVRREVAHVLVGLAAGMAAGFLPGTPMWWVCGGRLPEVAVSAAIA